MTRFDRYLIRTLFNTFIIALIFLISIDFLIQSAEHANQVGQGHYTLAIMLLSLAYQLPEKLILFAPAATLIGAIMGLGQLTSQNETTVVLTSGISRLRLVRGGIVLAATIGLLLLLIGEMIAPDLAAKGELIRSQALGQSVGLSSHNGLWINDHGSMTRIKHLNADGSLGELMRITPLGSAMSITQADSAHFQDGQWSIENPKTLNIADNHIVTHALPIPWMEGIEPRDIALLLQDNQHTNLASLYRQIYFLQANGLNYQEKSLAFWQKILLPLVIVTMTILALPLAFNQGRSAHQGTRLVAGIMLGIFFYMTQGILANLALILAWPAWLGAVLPIGIFSIIPLIMLNH